MIDNNKLSVITNMTESLDTYTKLNSTYPSVWIKNFIVPALNNIRECIIDINTELIRQNNEIININNRINTLNNNIQNYRNDMQNSISSINNRITNLSTPTES